jgi:tetratricopeptide (TPR) repeat protein
MKRALFACSLLIGLALFAAPATAQVGQVRGKVVDEAANPVPDATVLLEYEGGVTRKFELKTNKKGEYLQVGLQPGPYKITASKEGYRPSAVNVRVQLGQTTEIPDIQIMTATAAAEQPGSKQAEMQAKFKEAVQLAHSGQLDEAEALLKELLAEEPDLPEVYQNLGYLYAQRKNWPVAEENYQKALELRPGDPDLMIALAHVYQAAGQSDKALELTSQAAAANPEDAAAQFNKGILLFNQGDTAGAQKAFEAAIGADPELAEAHYYLATILVGQNKVPEAVAQLEKYLSMNPTNAQNVATAKGLLQALKK